MSDRIMSETDDDRPARSTGGGVMVDRVDDDHVEDEFEIIDEDSDTGAEEEPQGREAGLTERESADQPHIQQQQEGDTDQETRKARRDRAAERRRRKEGRDRTFAENANLRAELALLRQQLEGIAPRLSQLDRQRIEDQVAQTDQRIQESARTAAAARRKMAEAITSADAEAHANALEEWEKAREAAAELAQQKARLTTALQESERAPTQERAEPQGRQAPQQRQAAPAQLPPAVMDYVEDFRDRHNWMRMDQSGRPADQDTAIMLQIDNMVANEGYDPATQDYWDEVEERARKYLPHKFGNTRQERAPARAQQQERVPTRKGPMVAGSTEQAPARGSGNKVLLNKERKEALIMTGVLNPDGKTVENRELYTKYLRGFQKYDREHGITS